MSENRAARPAAPAKSPGLGGQPLSINRLMDLFGAFILSPKMEPASGAPPAPSSGASESVLLHQDAHCSSSALAADGLIPGGLCVSLGLERFKGPGGKSLLIKEFGFA